MNSAKSRLLFVVLVVALVALLFTLDARRRVAEAELKRLTVQMEQLQGNGNSEQNREIAQQIVAKVRRIIDIPADIEPTVATIVDVQKLRERNSFYDKAKNGDYLIVTPTRAILFDEQKNMVIDVIPVQLQQPAPAPADTPAAE